MPNAFVRKLKAYGSLSDEEVRLLVEASSNPKKVAARRDLIREGDQPGPILVVLEGWACRYKMLPNGSRQIMALLMPGDFCDVHSGTLNEVDHSIGTITACQIGTIPAEKMEALMIATPALTRAFWRSQLIDEGTLRAWIISLGRRDAQERTAHLMLELYIRMRNVGLTTDHTCQLPLTQTVLADALGLTPVHTNRVLRLLRERGIMILASGKLTITDAVALSVIAGFDENYLHRRIKNAA